MSKTIEIEGYCRLWGDQFSPMVVEEETGIHFDYKNEPGEIGKTGRYKGVAIPCGSGEIAFSETGASADLLSPDAPILEIIEKHQSSFSAAGATEIVLIINVFYKGQCNIEQSHKLLKRLAMLKVDLSISCQQL
ncbi:hypothetical protein [uncultured Desulfobacter sp.]|uniref:hypothetical protein n=1 Tax=uncultured Desulfobacter sp. TaxID=240139 RepID=UPI0029F58DF3|nr:hypothetical protein [uncultured Desulfobacter sp.]